MLGAAALRAVARRPVVQWAAVRHQPDFEVAWAVFVMGTHMENPEGTVGANPNQKATGADAAEAGPAAGDVR
jgi:hypothetical protein